MVALIKNKAQVKKDYLEIIGGLAWSPYDFVMFSYPWGEPRTPLENECLDGWQIDFLKDMQREIQARGFNGSDPVLPIKMSTATGHGVGKSALNAMIANFILNTRPMSKGVMTANTITQLVTKSWAELSKWTRLLPVSDDWHITSTPGNLHMSHKSMPELWRLDGLAWDENRPEAFAGLHAANSSPFFLMDEASAIPDVIIDTAEGGLTDGEPFLILWGNPTRTGGYFYKTFTQWRKRWINRRVDSRTARKTNKALIAQWEEDHGVDSDFFKIRVLGEFPDTGLMSLISAKDVDNAMKRELVSPNPTDPLIIGVDVARFGDDTSIIKIRQGFDGRSHATVRLKGVDTMQLASKVNMIAHELLPDAIFVDETGLGAGVVDRLHQLKCPRVQGVAFNNKSPEKGYANRASYMQAKVGEWLKRGGCLDHSNELREDLAAREYMFDANNQIKIESKDDFKDRMGRSPDEGDGLCLTFAEPVGPRDILTTIDQLHHTQLDEGVDFDPYNQGPVDLQELRRLGM